MAGRLIPTVSSAETWRQVYEQFQNINFTAFDFNAIKQSTLDYVKLYFPEIFNDFIESDEFIAWMELFAYVGELMAYRTDLNAHENLLPVAQRMGSVLRLAKFISYKSSRNIPARGLVKLISIRTTETVIDGQGNILTNKNIIWNDPTNPNWKDQFILVINRALNGTFGNVSPNERVQVQDVLFELYTFNNNPLPNGVIPYSALVSNTSYDFELVPTILTNNGPIEKRPENNSEFTVLYATDGLGDGSGTTGFLMFTKQGTLIETTQTFDGVTPNQTFDVGANNINETDLWLNNINPTTGTVTDDGSEPGIRSGEWIPVDISSAQNIIFNTNTIRNKYEVESLEGDDVRLVFGDGEFANVPSGTFNIWYRVSANADVSVPQNSISGQAGQLTYLDAEGNNQTLSFQFSLTTSIQNAAPTEDIEHIRRTAPGVYYTQDRMVNGQDYNTFMLQDPTILKLRSINRTFAGESNYINFSDPSEAYDNVKIFGNDLAIFYDTDDIVPPPIGASVSGTFIVENVIQPLLSDPTVYSIRVLRGDSNPGRRLFNALEINELPYRLGDTTPTHPIPLPSVGFPVYFVHDVPTDTWMAFSSADYFGTWLVSNPTNPYYFFVANTNPTVTPWIITHTAATLFADSEVTKFWFANSSEVVSFDTLDPANDIIAVLNANINANRNGVLIENISLVITGLAEYLNTGLENIHRLTVVPADENSIGLPTDVLLSPLLNPTIVLTSNSTPASYTVNVDGRASADGATGLPVPTAGYTFLEVGGGVTPDTATNIPNDLVSYKFTLEIDQQPALNTTVVSGVVQNLQKFYVTPDITQVLSNYRKFTITGSTGNDGTYTIRSFQFVNGTPGFQIVNVGGTQVLGSLTGLTNDIAATPGSQTVTFSIPHSGSDVTGLANNATVYTAQVTLGPSLIVVNLAVIGSTAQTYATLLGVIQAQLGALATIQQTGGNIVITNATTGALASVAILDVGVNLLFASLTNVDAPGSWITTPGTNTIAVTYSATITIDGTPHVISITGGQGQTYSDLITTLNGFLSGFGVVSLNFGNLQVTSNTLGTSSTVLITDGPPPNLFSSLDAFVAIQAAIAGTNTLGTELLVYEPIPSAVVDGNLNYHLASSKLSFNVTGTEIQTYGSLVAIINTNLQNLALTQLVDGNIKITSNTLGSLSKVNVTNYSDPSGIIQALATALVEPVNAIYTGDTEGTDQIFSMTVTVGGVLTTITFNTSQAQTYQQLADTILAQLPLTPPVTITFPGGNMRFTSLITTPPFTIVVAFIGGWDITYLGHVFLSDTSVTGSYGTQFTINGVNSGTNTWTILGNFAGSFTVGQTIVVTGNPDPAGNKAYVVVSATNVLGNTDIVVSPGTIPLTTTIGTGILTLLTTFIVPVPIPYIQGRGDVSVTGDLGFPITFNNISPYNVNNTIQNAVAVTNFNGNNTATIEVKDYVYFARLDADTEPTPIPPTTDNIQAFINDTASTNTNDGTTYSRRLGRSAINFFWMHRTRDRHLIDPASTNIIDGFIIQRAYYLNTKNWLNGLVTEQPAAPTPFDLRTSYGYLLNNRMLSDTMVLRSGTFKFLFGSHAEPSLQGTFIVIPSPTTTLTNNEIKQTIIQTVQTFFDIANFDFGETFYWEELAASIQNALPADLNSVVIVPNSSTGTFGDLFQIQAGDNEIFIPDVTADQISIVTTLSKAVLKQSS